MELVLRNSETRYKRIYKLVIFQEDYLRQSSGFSMAPSSRWAVSVSITIVGSVAPIRVSWGWGASVSSYGFIVIVVGIFSRSGSTLTPAPTWAFPTPITLVRVIASVFGGTLIEGIPGLVSFVVFSEFEGWGEDSKAEKCQNDLDSH